MFMRNFFSQWPILSPPVILTFPPESPCMLDTYYVRSAAIQLYFLLQPVNKMHDKATSWRWLINLLQIWRKSNIWDGPWQIKIVCTKKIKNRLNSSNACDNSVQNFVSSSFLQSTKMKTEFTGSQFLLWVSVSVKLGPSH